jgi:hypothetical protein
MKQSRTFRLSDRACSILDEAANQTAAIEEALELSHSLRLTDEQLIDRVGELCRLPLAQFGYAPPQMGWTINPRPFSVNGVTLQYSPAYYLESDASRADAIQYFGNRIRESIVFQHRNHP